MPRNLSESSAEPSARRAKRTKRWRRGLWLSCAVVLVLGGYFAFWRYHTKRFQAVRPGVFYRVAQPTRFGFWYAINRHGVRTVVNTRRYRNRLAGGPFDLEEPDGAFEADYVRELGARYVQWPLGDEPYWPWPTPWLLEEFLKLLDDPANRPVIVHCMGGRHRTGTLAALFRLEYDRWPVERALAEMYVFDFGDPIPVHEHNLRTYLPRPRPTAEQFQALIERFGPLVKSQGARPPRDYEALVRELRKSRANSEIHHGLHDYLARKGPFALCLAQRLVDRQDDLLVPGAARAAEVCLERSRADWNEWAMSADLIADFGTLAQQRRLINSLENEDFRWPPTPRYRAIVAGVTNRYTQTRLAYLRPMLLDTRRRPEPAANGSRYCDTATARMAIIVGRNFVQEPGHDGAFGWESGLAHARQWFEENPESVRLGQLVPPDGRNPVKVGRASTREDLSRR